MSFFSVPLSGLNASQSSLKAISSNLANVNTDGYKDQTVTFNDIFAQTGITNGALDPIQTGGGVATASSVLNFTDGTATPTNIASNLALSGNGFFVARQTNGNVAYTRAGDFTTNKAGQLVAPDGSLILGYPAQNGVVNTTAALQPLAIGTGLVIPATPTTSFTANVNLNATANVGDTASSSIGTIDSLGAPHNLQVTYTKTGTNTWSYAVNVPSSELASPTDPSAPTQTVASGNLSFDSSGNLTSSGTIAIAVPAYADGAAAQNINWSLTDKRGTSLLTQTDLPSGTSNVVQNGLAAGALASFTVEADGTVQGTSSNGSTETLGQVAVATVTNTQGLQQIGNNLFQATAGSGEAQIGVAGTGGRGTIKGGYVESSNVDTANEFSKMIVAQQAYQANAKVVTAFNQVEQSTLAMLQG